MKKHITIIGGGMGGCLMAIYLAQKNFRVTIYESREDIHTIPTISDKSINQSLSVRGIAALKQVGLWETIKKITLEQTGRVIHQKDAALYQAYGERQQLREWSINRNDLNKALLDAVAAYPTITIFFRTKVLSVNLKKKTLVLEQMGSKKKTTKTYDVLIGADGIHSTVRASLRQQADTQETLEYLDWGYKNIYIPAPKRGSLPFHDKAFHLWSKKKAAIFGIPNLHGFFTCTLTLPMTGPNSFATIQSQQVLARFFAEYFPDLSPYIPAIGAEFLHSKPSRFGSLYTSPWFYKDSVVLLGDACHAVTIFYGQGINAAFEDCLVLSRCLEAQATDWEAAFADYQQRRKPNTDLLADLCKKRFVELRDKYESPVFVSRSTVEMMLERFFPARYQSLYTLIVHTDLSYITAFKRYAGKRRIARVLGMDLVVFVYAVRHYARRWSVRQS